MIERLCGICGGAWGKNFKFCPSDGSALVAVDTIVVPPAAAEPARTRSRRAARPTSTTSRRPVSTRAFGAPEPAPREVDPIFFRRKSRDAAAFVETALVPRPSRANIDSSVSSAAEVDDDPSAVASRPATEPAVRAKPRGPQRTSNDLVQ